MDREFFCICAENGVSRERKRKIVPQSAPHSISALHRKQTACGPLIGSTTNRMGRFPRSNGLPMGARCWDTMACAPAPLPQADAFAGRACTANRMGRFPLSDVPRGADAVFGCYGKCPASHAHRRNDCADTMFFEKRHHAFFRGMPETKQTVGLVRIVHSQRFFILLFSLRPVNRRRFSFFGRAASASLGPAF